jgi:LysR family carnitine catabolism transcriptional activator
VNRRALEYFVAVVDHRTFTNASYALHVAQPSLSQAIKALEREIGAELFHRLHDGVRLTPAGEALLGPARQTLRDFDAAEAAAQNVSGLQAGRLDIVVLSALAADPLAAWLGRFHRAYPGVVIRITDPFAADALDLVRSGDSELALTYSPAHTSGLDVIAFPPEETLLVRPPGSPEPREGSLPLECLNDLELIMSSGTKVRALRMLNELGVAPRVVVETAHRDAIIPLVLADVGAALAPPSTAREAAAAGAVVSRLEPTVARNVVLACRPTGLTPAARAFRDLVEALHGDAAARANAVGS